MDPVGANLALGAVRRHALSARPGAPVVPDRRPDDQPPGPGLVRRSVARGLRRLADRLEPSHALR
jgi:hypothetical protein